MSQFLPQLNAEGQLAQSLIKDGVSPQVAFHIASHLGGPVLTAEKCAEQLLELYPQLDPIRLSDNLTTFVRHINRNF